MGHIPRELLSTSRYGAEHPFSRCLTPAAGKSTSRFDDVRRASIFRGASKSGKPTIPEIIAEMSRIADLYGIPRDLPKSFGQMLVNARHEGASIAGKHAYLLSASFGLSTSGFAAAEAEFHHAVGLARGLASTPLRLSDETFEVVVALMRRPGLTAALSLSPANTTRGPGRPKLPTIPTVPRDEQIIVTIEPPMAFQTAYNFILLEKDRDGGVFCYYPSKWIAPRLTGFAGPASLLPSDDHPHDQLSLGVSGTSVFAAILTEGPELVAPKDWGMDLADIKDRMRSILDLLAFRKPESWCVAVGRCVVE